MIPSWQEETNDAFIAGEEAEKEEAAKLLTQRAVSGLPGQIRT